MTVTTHFFDADWVLHSRPLNTKEVDGSHTAERIRQALEEELEEGEIIGEDGNASKLIAIATDNAANMKAAVSHTDATHIPCLGHTVNLAVKAGLATPRASRLNAKVKWVVENFHRMQAAEALRKKQTADDVVKALRLIQDVETGWTATSDMMERALKLKDHVQSILTSSEKRDVRDMALSAEDWFEVKELCAVLTPLCESMTELCGDQYCTASMLAVILPQVRQLLTPKEEDSPVAFQFKKAAKQNFAGRYIDQSFESLISQSCFLDPRCKSFFFITDELTRDNTKKLTIEAVKTKLRLFSHPSEKGQSESSMPVGSEPPTKKLKGFARVLSSALSRDSPAGTSSNTPAVSQVEAIDLEVSQYLAIEPPSVQTTPPEW
ncbi:Zinc finger BED domain-containing protein 1 [Holothuria leucospilota]|uniref:Zinc finger BED domain-containing protein 1 n=1 Tax=Holothuria leucospilota TaxID=206669 RepID=A0A9Q0YBQ5_HOLLE|nr:Zinc finger BED domain-containing protein 1 [Holothuria leucospilota]